MDIMRSMRFRIGATAGLLAVVVVGGCRSLVGPRYEYEEQLYLTVDGRATVILNASIPALVALRGMALDASPTGRTVPEQIRRAFQASGCAVDRVGQPWRRSGRRFVQVRISTSDVRTLTSCAPLGWSRYVLDRENGAIHFQQFVGASANVDPGAVNWEGSELVAFRLHLPSRINFHNVKRPDGTNGDIERGNILTWEQRLTDRRRGQPIEIDVRMDAETILYRTLWVFAGTFLAALAVLGAIVWWLMRRGKKPALPS